jgi:transcriptional regulator with XRE-family HTH domain
MESAMTAAGEQDMASGDGISDTIRQELARKRLSRAGLAASAGISLSSLEKGLSGARSFSGDTVVRLEAALGVNLRKAASGPLTAADSLGGYARQSVTWLEGSYVTLRPSSKRAQDIVSYLTEICWDDVANNLTFREHYRADKDYAQKGDVAVPYQSGHIYLVTNRHGQHRVMMLSRHGVSGGLHGLLMTLQQERGASLLPVSMPVALLPVAKLKEPPVLGVISPENKGYDHLRSALDRTLDGGFAVMLR